MKLYRYVVFILFISCHSAIDTENTYFLKTGDSSILKVNILNNQVVSISSCGIDSTEVGDKTEFYANGNIKKWAWKEKENEYPLLVMYYDSLGHYRSYKGSGIVSQLQFEGDVYFRLANPPFVHKLAKVRLLDTLGVVSEKVFIPEPKLEYLWFRYGDSSEYWGRTGMVVYYFLNRRGDILDSCYYNLNGS